MFQNQIETLPGGLFATLTALTEIFLYNNRLNTLPEGFFDGIGPVTTLLLHGNPGSPFILNIDLERRANGQVRARLPQAAPLPVEVTWMVRGTSITSTVAIPRGQRVSADFGMAMATPADIELIGAHFPGVSYDTSLGLGPGRYYSGFGLGIAPSRPSLVITPTRLSVPENGEGTYTVFLNTAPTGEVTVTPGIATGTDLTVTGALTFTTANWYMTRTVTVTAASDLDNIDDTATVTHLVSGYRPYTAATVIVTVPDTLSIPTFGTTTVPAQTYTARAVIPTLTLPAVDYGDQPLTYTLTGSIPVGLTFDATARTLAGIPAEAAPAVTLTYTVTDADDDPATLTFTVTVTMAVPGVTIFPTALSMNEGGVTTYTVVLATDPDSAVTVMPVATGPITGLADLAFSATTWNTVQIVTITAGIDKFPNGFSLLVRTKKSLLNCITN